MTERHNDDAIAFFREEEGAFLIAILSTVYGRHAWEHKSTFRLEARSNVRTWVRVIRHYRAALRALGDA